MKNLKEDRNVIILGKNEALVLRDHKNFHSLIRSFQINTNLNQFEMKKGVYYFTQRSLESLNSNKFKDILQETILIIDEFDWFLFEGTPLQMKDQIDFLRMSKEVYGFTGSSLTKQETTCLAEAFETQIVAFPSLNKLERDKRIPLQDILITTNWSDYINSLLEIFENQLSFSPIIIVAGQSYNKIENSLKRQNIVTFYSLKNKKGAAIDAFLSSKFLEKSIKNQYSVYLFNEVLGRGTDLKSDSQIEKNGGLYLILGDIFSKRAEEQILGRIGRLGNKGAYRYVVYSYKATESIAQAIEFKQQLQDNENIIKFSKLKSLLSNCDQSDNSSKFIQQQQVKDQQQRQLQLTKDPDLRNNEIIQHDKHEILNIQDELQEQNLEQNLILSQSILQEFTNQLIPTQDNYNNLAEKQISQHSKHHYQENKKGILGKQSIGSHSQYQDSYSKLTQFIRLEETSSNIDIFLNNKRSKKDYIEVQQERVNHSIGLRATKRNIAQFKQIDSPSGHQSSQILSQEFIKSTKKA